MDPDTDGDNIEHRTFAPPEVAPVAAPKPDDDGRLRNSGGSTWRPE